MAEEFAAVEKPKAQVKNQKSKCYWQVVMSVLDKDGVSVVAKRLDGIKVEFRNMMPWQRMPGTQSREL